MYVIEAKTLDGWMTITKKKTRNGKKCCPLLL